MVSPSLSQRTIVVTGASSGIGEYAARILSARGARVIPVGRDPKRTADVARILNAPTLVADFARLDDVRHLAERLAELNIEIDVMVHNAGGLMPAPVVTEDGFESTMQINFLAPFLLQRLVDPVMMPRKGHIVIASSAAHRLSRLDVRRLGELPARWSGGARPYADAKLADLLWARAISRRTCKTGLTAAAFHPGIVRTRFGTGNPLVEWLYRSAIGRPFTVDAAVGAEPIIDLASVRDPLGVNGTYRSEKKPDGRVSALGHDVGLGEQLWERAEQLLGLAPTDPTG